MKASNCAVSWRMLRTWGAAACAALLVACGGGGNSGAGSEPAPAESSGQGAALPASTPQPLEIPDALAGAPFEGRSLSVPPGFGIRLFARVSRARFLSLTPSGDVLVSVPSAGKVILLRERTDAAPQQFDYATGLQNPHDMAFHQIGDITYLYLSESNRITRSVYRGGETVRGAGEVVVAGLPDDSTPELRGRYGHQLKNIALSPDHKLYVAIGSACNACEEDASGDPVRGAIYEYNADGSAARLYAEGLRNASSLNFMPTSGALWAVVNHRDEVRYPLDADITGDGASDLGRLIPAYVDDNPPDLFTAVRDGAHYGWPFCNALPNEAMTELAVLHDHETNPGGTRFDCARVTAASKGVRAHSAPLGFSFLHGANVPTAYRSGAVIALHGCWNCTSLRAGYKVVFAPFDAAGNAGAIMDLVSGFVTDPDARSFWGRPVDAIADGQGGILISDDHAGALYRLYPRS